MLRAEITPYLPEETRALRQAVFMDEQGFSYEFDETDLAALHITLYEDGDAVACCRIFPEGPRRWHVGRVAVRQDCRGRNLGALVMAEAEKAAAIRGGETIVLSAQVRASGFYRKLGYAQEGEEYLDEHCPHIHMKKEIRAGLKIEEIKTKE
ncbi:GNAT family N-acetyltransferase [Acutalibacter sp. 1XD8-33]|uniref:GNAT family N-acetyltransferase n=1 Tax=Acutalibacter sp. 1XD8-33 TaxID=2320081 RepID=UPI000EA17A8D|nr:GNAT family N-acetyltransferase [Acutalibacter sp. 1XD8-33]RKJ40361.1 GNAT family N-acetyltransferase [Acutalibacter sp. 1XD8-33]